MKNDARKNFKVSVIIPAYNAERFLKNAVDSVLHQTYQDIEVIVVDDGSTDSTRKIAEEYGTSVIYIHQENSGHAVARNTGLKRANGEFCAFLDADDYWLPQKIERQVNVLVERPEAGIVHCDHTKIDSSGNTIHKPHRDKKLISGRIFKNLLLRKGHIGTSTALFRRECFERWGLFDETKREWGSEDREFWLRLSKHYEVEYLEESLVFYRYREKSLSRSRKIEDIIKGRYWAIDESLKDVKPVVYSQILRRMAYSAIHKELGYLYLLGRHPQLARVHYLKVLRFWPFQIGSWLGFFRSMFNLGGAHGQDISTV